MAANNIYKWSFLDRTGIAVINFGVNIALVRMLTTADFGLLAMVAIFTAIASDLSSCGLSDGLIHKTKPTELDYSTVFVFNAGVGLCFGLAFFFGAPLVAQFFGHRELVLIMRVLGVSFVFQTMGYVQETRLRKELKMKKLCLARIGGTLTASACAIVAAALGYGYKALIFTQILLYFFFFCYYTCMTRWFPHIAFSVKAFKEFFGYGVHLMLAYLASLVGRNINTFVMGRFYPTPSMSGIYYQGAKLAVVPFGITEGTLNYPFFAVASNEADPIRRTQLLVNMYGTILFVNALIVLALAVMASPIIICIFGAKWAGAVPILRILAVAEFLMALRAYFQTVCKVHGRTAMVRNLGFAEVAMQLTLLAIFFRHGIIAIAWTQVGGVALTTLFYTVFTFRYFGLRPSRYAAVVAQSLWLPVTSALLCLVAAILIPGSQTSWYGLLGCGAVFLGTAIALGEMFRPGCYMTIRNRFIS